MSLVIPDSKFEMPALFYPNRKPVGNVKIDWGHPLSKGLVGLWLFNNRTFNLVTEGFELSDTNVNYVETLDGKAGVFGPGASRSFKLKDAAARYASDKFTYFSRFKWYAQSSAGRLVSNTNSSNIGSTLQVGGGAYAATCYINTGSWTGTFGNTVPAGVVTSIASTYDRKNVKVYNNGIVTGSSSLTGTPAHSLLVTELGARVNDTTENFDGEIYYTSIYDKALSEVEVSSLTSNPYQLLIPA